MEVPTIQDVDRDEARRRLQEFTARRRGSLTEMDRALQKGYRALSKGLSIIDVNDAIKAGGVFAENGLPRLALSRPEFITCYVQVRAVYKENAPASEAQFGCAFAAYENWQDDPYIRDFIRAPLKDVQGVSPWEETARRNLRIELPGGTLPRPPEEIMRSPKKRFAMHQTIVPEIPLQFRVPAKEAEHHLVLWEVKEWTMRAPSDPLLLERIAHPLYVVVAQWDLTELEQKILETFRGRRP
jgi:hypothetical protein